MAGSTGPEDTEGSSGANDGRRLAILVSAALVAMFVFTALVYATGLDRLDYADERAHVALAQWIATTGDLWPDYRDLLMINEDGTFADFPNYVKHPPPYYWLQAATLAATRWLPFQDQVLVARLGNVLLTTLGLVVTAIAAIRWKPTPQDTGAFVGLVSLLPGLLVVQAGTVTNDNLAFLGGAVLVLGAMESLLRPERDAGWWLLGLGTAVAAAAKLTAALQFGPLVLGLFAVQAFRTRGAVVRRPAFWGSAALCALGALAHGINLPLYGHITPIGAREDEVMAWWLEAFGVQHWADQRLSFPAYLAVYGKSLFVTAMPGVELHTYTVRDAWTFGVYPLFLGVGVAGLVRAVVRLVRREDDPLAWLIVLGAASALLMVLAHIGFGYKAHLNSGYLRGIWARYYYPGLPILAVACLYALDGIRQVRTRTIAGWVLFAGIVLYRLLAERFQEWNPFDDTHIL